MGGIVGIDDLKHYTRIVAMANHTGAESFDKYVQLAAFFTYPNLTDEEGWNVFLKARENFLSQCQKYGIRILTSAEDLADFENSDEKFAFILAVEDMRIVSGKTG